MPDRQAVATDTRRIEMEALGTLIQYPEVVETERQKVEELAARLAVVDKNLETLDT